MVKSNQIIIGLENWQEHAVMWATLIMYVLMCESSYKNEFKVSTCAKIQCVCALNYAIHTICECDQATEINPTKNVNIHLPFTALITTENATIISSSKQIDLAKQCKKISWKTYEPKINKKKQILAEIDYP